MDKKQLSELHYWDRNPRRIQEDDFDRLKDQITSLGQYKPLLAMPDGTVLGGNMRLRALEALGQPSVWVSTIDFVEEGGLWYAIVNGERQAKPFPSKLAGMTEYALSDNDRAGYYNDSELDSLLAEIEIDTSMYSVDFSEPLLISEIAPEHDAKPKGYKVIIECQNDSEQKEIAQNLTSQGYKVKPIK